ncbi:Tellurium resistance protein terC, putative [Perkinsus marinus ATCC 50983]|uniref:Tellurium resistance protein terC, putative n=2 Tax=Perkinsus marinus (strain ATCC 50983 / TXsc) TaxID=423536 RepID=C5KWA7_PERM5|nr:Tellurium resistance protein terC, putative [Perkinsus marinus ATCC 50983]EER11218.1 Tellurium resistance protein terC, putative [Perkinsus marinus ATCC 50983]|eukprot:XP_002779423.1 Tellurium resistance protein terC, putative [Perkinsus marinus ATCC 50983]
MARPVAATGGPSGNSVLCWVVFASTVAALLVIDAFIINRGSKIVEVPPRRAMLYCIMYLISGLLFNVVVYVLYGYNSEAAFGWFNGYVLEYMLSMDNVFFFQVIFKYYRTPKCQVNRALFYGIGMAAALRLLFFFLGTTFFKLISFTRYIFGLVLIWSGYKTATDSDDQEAGDPNNACAQCITSRLRLFNAYSSDGAFVVKVPRGTVGPPIGCDQSELIHDTIPRSSEEGPSQEPLVYKATLLSIVVIVLGVVDVIFAVDSVTAKISQYDDMFINFSSSIFAMLTLRSLYFLVVYLADLFVFMKYGIALILVLVGLQLLFGSYIDISNRQSCGIISLVFFASIFASVVYSKCAASCSRRGSIFELEVIGSRHIGEPDIEIGAEHTPQEEPSTSSSTKESPLE